MAVVASSLHIPSPLSSPPTLGSPPTLSTSSTLVTQLNDHRTVTLEDLVDYAADQEKRIKRVFATGEVSRKAGGKGAFRNAGSAWEDFWRSVWGYEPDFFDTVEAQFDRGDDPIDDFSIQSEDPFDPQDDPGPRPSSPTFDMVSKSRRVLKIPKTFFRALGERTSRILIRTEYDHAEAAALSAEGAGARVFHITGQPGTGSPLVLPPRHALMVFTREIRLLVLPPHQAAFPQAPNRSTIPPGHRPPFSQ